MSNTETPIRRRPGPLPDYYRILGIPADASGRDIEDAYWERAHRAHARSRRASVEARLRRLNAAYEVLGCPDSRAAYDAKRRKSIEAKQERSWLRTLLRLNQTAGTTLAEYSLILTVVAIGVVVPTMLIFRDTLSSTFSGVTSCLGGSC